MQIAFQPLNILGAEVTGLDLLRPLCSRAAGLLRKALVRHQLLVFRGQEVSPTEQIRLTRAFGSLEPGIPKRPASHHVQGYPDLLQLSNAPDSPTIDYGMSWHSDGLAYARVPCGVTVLHCLDCPDGVGDTLFADQYAAHDSLPKDLRATVRDLAWYLPPMPFTEVPAGSGLTHPIVRVHLETRRKFLYCAPNAERVRGMTAPESEELLARVRERQWHVNLIHRHRWRRNDIVLWENCTLLHNRADIVDAGTHGMRLMHRSATAGCFEAVECDAPDKPGAI